MNNLYQPFIQTVTTKGQVTIPAPVRKLLGITANDKVIFQVIDGKVELKPPILTLRETFGSVFPLKKRISFKKMREIVRKEKVLSYKTKNK